MSKLRFSEYFLSIQGEGQYVGVPSVFLRLFGCNFECAGFGQPRGHLIPRENMPWNILNTKDFTDVKQLPVFHIGCDSSASWASKYMHMSKFEEHDQIAKQLENSCPSGSWVHKYTKQDTHLIVTGGEPLLWQKQLPDLLNACVQQGLKNITFETNATQTLTPQFKECLHKISNQVCITWSCSPKLSISGEKWEDAIKPQNWQDYKSIPNSQLYLKFVINDAEDITEVKKATEAYTGDIYLMPVGGTSQMLEFSESRVCELAMKEGYKFSPRLHVNLFGNQWGT